MKMWSKLSQKLRQSDAVKGLVAPLRLADQDAHYRQWLRDLARHRLLGNEALLPQIRVPVPSTPPAPMEMGALADADDVRQRVAALRPWGYSIPIAKGLVTGPEASVERMIYRAHLIEGALRAGFAMTGRDIAQSSLVDFACNHGYFAILARHIGLARAAGLDLRPENARKAQLLAEVFGHGDVAFDVMDIYDYAGQADVVLNLGLLYHVTDPVRLMQHSFDTCRAFCILDTITHKSPVSAFILRCNKDPAHHAEGAYTSELHPTYRAAIDLMHAVGFCDLHEIRPQPSPDCAKHPLYDRFERRCLIGFRPEARPNPEHPLPDRYAIGLSASDD